MARQKTGQRIHAELRLGQSEHWLPMSVGDWMGNLIAAIYDERITHITLSYDGTAESEVRFVKTPQRS